MNPFDAVEFVPDWRDEETKRFDREFDAMMAWDASRRNRPSVIQSKLDVCNWMEVLGIPVKYDA